MKLLDTKLMHPADQLIVVISRIYRSGLTTTSGGNISIKDDNGDIWITPAGVDKGSLTKKDIVCVKADGTISGIHRPSSEYPFHKAIYEIRPQMTAVIHAHPPALVAFSITHQIPDTNIIPQAKGVCGTIGFAKYDVPGSKDLGKKIADEFKTHPDYKAVIMENHGVVLCGEDLKDAYQRFETLEFCARTVINAHILGKPEYLTDEQIQQHERAIPTDFPYFLNVTHPSDEREIRDLMIKIIHRACDQGLMISSYGTVSVRWRNNDFLITPVGVPRWDMDTEDIVQVKDGKVEVGKVPSRSIALHQEIYQTNPKINSIILTQPPHLMGYCTSGVKLNVRTIPESWIFLKDIPTMHFGIQYEDNKGIAEVLKTYPAVLLSNDSVIITGDGLLNTFDRLEIAEFSAQSLIMGERIGKLQPISDEEVEDLRVAFNVQ
ncbi:MAG: class II aldolase/adducin family protein [Tannerella sp.]|jgi:L-fuculose-phosphate aldolase|nr:class II aldolase/adducin family protein [Tannerella sp.]